MIEMVMSGGQAGVDQAALLIASELGIDVGGFCPHGGLDENGIFILEKYPSLRQTTTSNPDQRTKLNIEESDGTLIIVPSSPLPERIKDGTRLTEAYAKEIKKPLLTISLMERNNLIDRIKQWIISNEIKKLNIAGPRESNSPGIYLAASDLFRELFTDLIKSMLIKNQCKSMGSDSELSTLIFKPH